MGGGDALMEMNYIHKTLILVIKCIPQNSPYNQNGKCDKSAQIQCGPTIKATFEALLQETPLAHF